MFWEAFWIGVAVGTVIGSNFGILIYAIITANEVKDKKKKDNKEIDDGEI